MIKNSIKIYIILIALAVIIKNQCSNNDQQYFLTFHPHLDAFWLNTDDQLKNQNFRPQGFLYAMNQRNSKQIFNSMLQALNKNQIRKYFVTQIVFFKDWYQYISKQKKQAVKRLLKNNQLQIPNGGWVQNDEAVCYYDDIIDQYTVGMNFLNSQFGIVPKIAWATDSFGHSHSQVAIQHLLGFQYQGIERIDDRYIYQRKGSPLLQFYWSAVSDSNNKKYGGVFTYVRHFLHEVNNLRNDYGIVNQIKQDNLKVKSNMAKLYRRNKFFRFLGNDFEQFIDIQFQHLEKAMNEMNKGQNNKCPVFKYGNPTDYFQSIKDPKSSVSIREHDFIPNHDQDHYWSGYYTTDPDLKKICKDFSRLVNIFRKIYTKFLLSGGKQNNQVRKLLITSDQLLAVMQHHDGITATSKTYIEELFKDRMRKATSSLIDTIAQLKGLNKQACKLYENGNKCKITSKSDEVYLSILHEGAQKKERISLVFQEGTYYDIDDENNKNIFCEKSKKCTLVFDKLLKSGENVLKLKKISQEQAKKIISEYEKFENEIAIGIIKVKIQSQKIRYTINNNQFIQISTVLSQNINSGTQTKTWDKYGRPIQKVQNRVAGIYIMFNNGKLLPLPQAIITESYVAKGSKYNKYIFKSGVGVIQLTSDLQRPEIIQVQTKFTPPSRDIVDYFIKITTSLNLEPQFYHDMNGYLVSKRKIGERPDYQWKYKSEDKINANTYPMCSFVYGFQGNKKLFVFSERAQGVTKYDNSILLNIDRLTYDDWKGVGQGYNNIVENTFRHIIGIVKKDNFIQREIQKKFDQPLIAFYSTSQRQQASVGTIELAQQYKYLKYTIFSLNQNEFVLRIHNLNQKDKINIPIYSQKQWFIKQLGLHLQFTDIKPSFANGVALQERYSFVKIQGQVNIFNAGSEDTPGLIMFQPLQIRSWRINLKNSIVSNEQPKPTPKPNPLPKPPLYHKNKFGNRCF